MKRKTKINKNKNLTNQRQCKMQNLDFSSLTGHQQHLELPEMHTCRRRTLTPLQTSQLVDTALYFSPVTASSCNVQTEPLVLWNQPCLG